MMNSRVFIPAGQPYPSSAVPTKNGGRFDKYIVFAEFKYADCKCRQSVIEFSSAPGL